MKTKKLLHAHQKNISEIFSWDKNTNKVLCTNETRSWCDIRTFDIHPSTHPTLLFFIWGNDLTDIYCEVIGGSRGEDRGSLPRPPPPLKNHKNIGFLSNTGPELQKWQSYQARFNVGSSSARQWNAIEMAFRWGADDGPLIVLFGSSDQKNKNTLHSWTPSGKTFSDLRIEVAPECIIK